MLYSVKTFWIGKDVKFMKKTLMRRVLLLTLSGTMALSVCTGSLSGTSLTGFEPLAVSAAASKDIADFSLGDILQMLFQMK